MRLPGCGKEIDGRYGKYTHVSDNGTIFSSSAIDSVLLDDSGTSEGGCNGGDWHSHDFITENGTIFSSSLASVYPHDKNYEEKEYFSKINNCFHEDDKTNCSPLMTRKYISNDGTIFSSSFDLTFNRLSKSYDNFSFEERNYEVPNDRHFSSTCNQRVSLLHNYNEESNVCTLSSGRRSFGRERRMAKVKNRSLKKQMDQVALLPNKISLVEARTESWTEPSALSKSLTFPHHTKLLRCVQFCAHSDCAGIKVKPIHKQPTIPKSIRVHSKDRSSEIQRFQLSQDDQQSLMSEGTIQPQYWKGQSMWEQSCNNDLENSPKITRSPWNCKLWNEGIYEKKSNIQKLNASFWKSKEEQEGNGEDSETVFYKVWESSLRSNSIIMSSEDEHDLYDTSHLDKENDREGSIERRKKRLWRRCLLKISSEPRIIKRLEKHLEEDDKQINEEENEKERDVLAELFWPDGIGNSYEDFFLSLFCPENSNNENGEPAKDSERGAHFDHVQLKSQKIKKDRIKQSKANVELDVQRTCVNSFCMKSKDTNNEKKVKNKTESNSTDQQVNRIAGQQSITSGGDKSTRNCMEFLSVSQERGTQGKNNNNNENMCDTLMESLATKFYSDENLFLNKLEELFLGPDEDSPAPRLMRQKK